MDRNLALEVVRVTEAAALASARLMGRGDAEAVDRAGGEAMRRAFDAIDFRGRIVIGEGRAGEVEHLWAGETIGTTALNLARYFARFPSTCASSDHAAVLACWTERLIALP